MRSDGTTNTSMTFIDRSRSASVSVLRNKPDDVDDQGRTQPEVRIDEMVHLRPHDAIQIKISKQVQYTSRTETANKRTFQTIREGSSATGDVQGALSRRRVRKDRFCLGDPRSSTCSWSKVNHSRRGILFSSPPAHTLPDAEHHLSMETMYDRYHAFKGGRLLA